MEVPTPSAALPVTALAMAATAAVDMDAVSIAPRSGCTEPSDADPVQQKIRLMCSYGGQIIPRPHDKMLCYVGGDTRIIAVNRGISFSDLLRRLSRELLYNQPFSLKYQLPSEDLESLISVDNEEDLENMVDEYDRSTSAGGGSNLCRFRLFLFPKSPSSIENLRSGIESVKLKDSCNIPVNRKSSLSSGDADRECSSINRLLGLEDNCVVKAEKVDSSETEKVKIDRNDDGNCVAHNHDVQLISDSPFPETISNSASDSPPQNNLPHVSMNLLDNQKIGLPESEIVGSAVSVLQNVNVPPQIQDGNGGSVPGSAATGVPIKLVIAGGETDRHIPNDDKSDLGVQRMALETRPQLLPRLQHKLSDASDSYSPDSASSENGVLNPSASQGKATHQEQPLNQIQPGNIQVLSSNPHGTETVDSQLPEQGHMISSRFDQNHPHLNHAPHFVHSFPSGPLPFASYYPVLHPQHQHSHPPLYYLSSVPCYGEFAPAAANLRNANAPSSQRESSDVVYRTVGYNQAPFCCNQIDHTSQFIAHSQMSNGPMIPQMTTQFRTLNSAPAIVVPNAAPSQLQPEIQSSQP